MKIYGGNSPRHKDTQPTEYICPVCHKPVDGQSSKWACVYGTKRIVCERCFTNKCRDHGTIEYELYGYRDYPTEREPILRPRANEGETKTCIKCGKTKPATEFQLNGYKNNRRGSCKECDNAYQRERYRKMKEERRRAYE